MKALNNIDLKNNELQNAVIQPLSSPPENPRFGQIYTDNADNKMKWFNGSEWKNLGSSDEPIKNTKTVRYVIGTSTNGWTESDCDYLCDGVDDQVEINAAIQALPSTGGEIKILDGTYNITANISMNKDNVKLSGNGTSTILKAMWDSSISDSVINITASNGGCIVKNLNIDGNKDLYSTSENYGIYLSNTSNNTIENNTCNNNICGIGLSYSLNNFIKNNICNYNKNYGINLSSSDENFITNNISCNNNYGMRFSTSDNINVISNICNENTNSGMYIGSCHYSNIIGNNCNENLGSSGIYFYTIKNDVISNNICNNNKYGFYCYNVGGSIIIGNKCLDNEYGMYFDSRLYYSLITSNSCYRGAEMGFEYSDNQHTIYMNAHYRADLNTITNNLLLGKDLYYESPLDSYMNVVYGNMSDGTTDVATKDYVNEQLATKATKLTFSIQFPNNWIQYDLPTTYPAVGPEPEPKVFYSATISNSNILETDTPHIVPIFSLDKDVANAQINLWNYCKKAVAISGGIQFIAYDDPSSFIPSVEMFDLQIEVIR